MESDLRNSSFMDSVFCIECGWNVIWTCCNGGMSELPYGEFDYWYYCSNKSCVNHSGEGSYSCQEFPRFIRE